MSFKAIKVKRTMSNYKEILEIYKNSFPKVERFPIILLQLMSHLKGINFVAFYDDDKLCGFSYFLQNEETVFILFLAVNDKIRSRGYGSQIISWIKDNYPGRKIFLDAEKLDDNAANNNQRIKRIEFYKRNGIFQTNQFFTYDNVTYEILCTDKNFNEEDYNKNLVSYFKIFKKKRKR